MRRLAAALLVGLGWIGTDGQSYSSSYHRKRPTGSSGLPLTTGGPYLEDLGLVGGGRVAGRAGTDSSP